MANAMKRTGGATKKATSSIKNDVKEKKVEQKQFQDTDGILCIEDGLCANHEPFFLYVCLKGIRIGSREGRALCKAK